MTASRPPAPSDPRRPVSPAGGPAASRDPDPPVPPAARPRPHAEGATASTEDRTWLERARRLGRGGWGQVQPNPMVGCVLVRDGRVVGEGHHARYGGPHAEVLALEAAGEAARGATAYVSLEPCAHHGKTPPCTRALLQAGVRRVVYGAADPGAESGGGGAALAAAGVDVAGPVWSEEEARAENPEFFHRVRHGTPWVALKLAMSLDARISAGPGLRTRITGPEAEREVHRLRSGFGAVIVGSGTARADDPRLTVREAPPGRVPPRRMVLDPEALLAPDAALLREAGAHAGPVDVFVASDADDARIRRLRDAGAHVHPVPRSPEGLELGAVLETCAALGVGSLLCEGGQTVAGSLLRERRAHRLYLFVAPRTLGGEGLPAFTADAGALDWRRARPAAPPELFGPDALLVYDLDGA